MRHLFLFCILVAAMFIAGYSSQAQEWSRLSPAPLSGWAQSLCGHQGTTLIMAQPGGLYRSTDNGSTWIIAASNDYPYGAFSIASDGSNLYAARGYGGVSLSTDNGVNWIQSNVGLPGSTAAIALAAIGGNVFVGLSGGGVYASANDGSLWTRADSGMAYADVTVLAGTGDTIFAGTHDGKVFRSTNAGLFWTNVSPASYSTSNNVNAVFIAESSVLLGDTGPGSSPGILRSDDWGMTWTQFSTGIGEPTWGFIAGFARVDTFLFTGLYQGFGHGGVYRGSLNSDWSNVSAAQMIAVGPPDTYYIPAWSFASLGTTVFAGMAAYGLYRSTDFGATWQQITSDVSAGLEERIAFASRDDTLYTGGSSSHAFISTDGGAFWEEHLTNLYNDITSYVFVDSVLFAGHGYNAGTSRSMDGGRVWESVVSGMPTGGRWINDLASSGTTLLAATRGGVFMSSDFGDSWATSSWGTAEAISIHASASVILASGLYEVYRSTDVGQTWAEITNGLPASWTARDYSRIGNNLFMGGGASPFMHMSTDEGSSWTGITGPFTSPVWALATDGDTLYAATESFVAYTTDLGQSWQLVTNSGLSGIVRFRALMVKGGYIYAGMGAGGSGAFRIPIPGTTSVESTPGVIPEEMKLFQNFPNPFNPTTRIRFRLPAGQAGITDYGLVKLVVHDLLGREVATLVNESLSPGEYTSEWNAGGFASGVYFYSISAAGYTRSMKLLLLR